MERVENHKAPYEYRLIHKELKNTVMEHILKIMAKRGYGITPTNIRFTKNKKKTSKTVQSVQHKILKGGLSMEMNNLDMKKVIKVLYDLIGEQEEVDISLEIVEKSEEKQV